MQSKRGAESFQLKPLNLRGESIQIYLICIDLFQELATHAVKSRMISRLQRKVITETKTNVLKDFKLLFETMYEKSKIPNAKPIVLSLAVESTIKQDDSKIVTTYELDKITQKAFSSLNNDNLRKLINHLLKTAILAATKEKSISLKKVFQHKFLIEKLFQQINKIDVLLTLLPNQHFGNTISEITQISGQFDVI